MKQHDVKYSFSATLLDSFQGLLDSEETWNKFWGDSEEPSKSLEEYEEECTTSILNYLNRIPFSSEAAAKGTCFNDLVDTLIHKYPCGKTKITRGVDADGNVVAAICELNDGINSYRFDFDINMAKSAAEYFEGYLSQVLVNSYIDTKYGVVNLYGFIDEMSQNLVKDIKTTSRYEFGNYAHKWQRHVYPYCLIESGMVTYIKEFEYTVFLLKGGTSRTPIITADAYREAYTYNHEQSTKLIREQCERLIEFIEEHRDVITCDLVFHEHEHNH